MSEAAASAAGFSGLLSDERLTRRAVGGDDRAFAAIFRRYHQSLYRFCLAIVGNPEDAQDALQNTMMKVLRALPGEERKIELKPWLYRIAHNESIDLLRRRRETRQLDAEQVAPGYGLAEAAATRERLRRLFSDLRELPERQREVLVMRELAGLKFEEIGAALDTSGAVARQTLYEARLSLRQMEEGREMRCDAVTKALSDGDGRITRRRDVRAHLRSCAACRGFREEIKGRQQDLAALSPLPAVAAAGMLQGLIGGSSGAATSGGLAATLGGGAAKTIAGSAAAKGVATAAVVAAVGVTAADRTGVIHAGLPWDGGAKSSTPTPGSDGGSPNAQPGISPASPVGDDSDPSSGAERGVENRAEGAGPKVTPGAESQQGQGHGHGKGQEHSLESPAGPKGQGPPLEQATGKDHEKQHPEAAGDGQETAAEAKPPPREPSEDEKGGRSETKPKPEHKPNPEPPESPEETSPNPPQGAAPNPPPQAQKPPEPPGKAAEPSAPGKSGEQGKGAEKKPQAPAV
jgi:RNA polymerase sigma factor (sigma-70 family)